MRVETASLLSDLRARYLEHPCRVSCLALWKTEELCRAGQTYRVARHGHTTLYALRGERLEVYWSDDPASFALSDAELAGLDFMVLHEKDYALVAPQLRGYTVDTSRPMLYERREPPNVRCPRDMVVRNVDVGREGELDAVARMLNRCYPGHRHTSGEVAGWRELPAFDPALWFWVVDRASGAPVALAISTYQASIRETYLDWIQVAPSVRGRGLGRLLVAETLRRALPKSDIVRVTGVADDFYRSCGFVNRELWVIARRG